MVVTDITSKQSNISVSFLKENVKNLVWICKDLIALILGNQ